MSRKMLLFLLVAVLLTGCVRPTEQNDSSINGNSAAASETTEGRTDEVEAISYSELYRDILNEFYSVIAENKESTVDGTWGVGEQMLYLDSAAALERIGYGITDISGDGIPELIIGSVTPEGEMAWGTMIYAVYTADGGEPMLLLEGRTKHSYRPVTDGGLFYQGTEGAIYTIFGTFDFAENGKSLIPRDYYFTYEKNDDKTEIGFFHNTTGEWNRMVSEELLVTQEEFSKIQLSMMESICKWELTPFAHWEANSN